MKILKEPFCPYCYNGTIVKIYGVYICNICKEKVRIKQNRGK